jgi:hypothetical protein
MQLQRVCHDTLPWLISFSLGCYHAMKIYNDELLEILRALRQTYSDSRQPN